MSATDRPALVIEITPEMIEAGKNVLVDHVVWGGDRSGFFDDDGYVGSDVVIRRILVAVASVGLHQERALVRLQSGRLPC